MLSALLVGVRVEQGANAGHGEHHVPVCVFLCRLLADVAFCLSLIRWAYAFRCSCDGRDLILLRSYANSP